MINSTKVLMKTIMRVLKLSSLSYTPDLTYYSQTLFYQTLTNIGGILYVISSLSGKVPRCQIKTLKVTKFPHF